MRRRIVVASSCLLLQLAPCLAQAPRPAVTAPAPPPAAGPPAAAPPAGAPGPALPQQTTASFGDWVLRCTRVAAQNQVCEVVETISREDRPVAQIAIGHLGHAKPLHLTVLVPSNVTLGTAPALVGGREAEAPAAELAWRRCIPAGCLAETTLSDDSARRVRGWTEPGRIQFLDGAGRAATLPFSATGLPQALDALAKEDGV